MADEPTAQESSEEFTNNEQASNAGAVITLPLVHQVASLMRDMIVQDELKQGEPIRERIVSEALNVSRTPLREGLKILAAEGLVELIPNRGAIVANPTPEETRDKLILLSVLEAFAGELAVKFATKLDVDEITALHYEMLAAQKRNNRLQYFKLNQDIHSGIVRLSQNSALIENHTRLNLQVYRARYRNNLKNTEWGRSISEHEKIIAVLQERNGDALSAILRRHMEPVWANVMEEAVNN
ncbi:GntR family transcriptional regulator [Sneathiella marina]|uniref:GntR family transcriptional regulator n=1 Tax=Sneathiella marina TaxID=2950108 RepID=A0ABY4W080_9PROT|nr:GntR family transcriptional regulator [Sneathiella marina]USG60369.1 GntR family transcriptional regulator [Sneathiella marina]